MKKFRTAKWLLGIAAALAAASVLIVKFVKK